MDIVRPYYKSVIISSAYFLSNVTSPSRQRVVRKVFWEAFPFTEPNGGLGLNQGHLSEWRRVQYPAVKHVGIGGSHIHDWQSAQSTIHPIPVMLMGGRELTSIYFGNSFIYLSIRYLRVYKLMAIVRRTQYKESRIPGRVSPHTSWCQHLCHLEWNLRSTTRHLRRPRK